MISFMTTAYSLQHDLRLLFISAGSRDKCDSLMHFLVWHKWLTKWSTLKG